MLKFLIAIVELKPLMKDEEIELKKYVFLSSNSLKFYSILSKSFHNSMKINQNVNY